MSIKGRLDKLEKNRPRTPLVCWSNLWCPLDEIEPDASGIDWLALRTNPKPWTRESCPIDAAIRAALESVPTYQEGRDEER